MDLATLQRLADDFRGVTPAEFPDLADACRDLAVNHLDVRFMVLGECFRLSESFWGPGDGIAVPAGVASDVYRLWGDYLPGVLQSVSEEEATALALALKEELSLLAANFAG